MYTGKNLRRVYKRRQNRKAGLFPAVLFLISTAVGIYGLMSMLVFAAPENPAVEIRAEEISAEEIRAEDVEGQEGRALENRQLTKEMDGEKSAEPVPFLIAVDAGHGGMDDGCLGNGAFEKEINLQIALLVREKLEKKGFQVMMPRETDEYLEKEERVELANSYQADAYISIHQNTYEGSDKSVSGIEVWYDGADNTRDSGELARLVHQEAVKSTGANKRELWDIADYVVTNRTLMPACLIETGFLSNPEECRRLASAEYQEKIAEGIAKGVALYFQTENSVSGIS